jgi:CTP:molybdopterin cytidylyltransferase MocA
MGAEPRLAAIVLAGDRGPVDPVATAAGVAAKCLATVGGTPMAVRVLRALEASGCVEHVVLCGPAAPALSASPELGALVAGSGATWRPPEATPSLSAAAALAAVPDTLSVLLTTGDHALLTPDMVRHFVGRARTSGADVAVALAPHALVRARHPGTRRTLLAFRDGRFCACNLFAFLTPRGRDMARLWRQVEAERKRPLRVIGFVGWDAVALYALGLLSLDGALGRLARRTGIRGHVVSMPFADAAIDVDSVADLELARAIAAGGA